MSNNLVIRMKAPRTRRSTLQRLRQLEARVSDLELEVAWLQAKPIEWRLKALLAARDAHADIHEWEDEQVKRA